MIDSKKIEKILAEKYESAFSGKTRVEVDKIAKLLAKSLENKEGVVHSTKAANKIAHEKAIELISASWSVEGLSFNSLSKESDILSYIKGIEKRLTNGSNSGSAITKSKGNIVVIKNKAKKKK